MNRQHYLLYVTLPYAFTIMRPLQEAIRQRGATAAWFVEEGCAAGLAPDELQLHSFDEVEAFDPVAVFAPGNYIPDFFPGIKVALFHGYAIQKRYEAVDDHFTIRGWFDIYCTQGPSSTPYFKELEAKHRFFKVYETGWTKADTYFSDEMQQLPNNPRPLILYAPTFTKNVCSAPHIVEAIRQMVETKPWDWIITFHPKLNDPDVLAAYKGLAAKHDNVTFFEGPDKLGLLRDADVMLCDSSSIILEFMFLGKPVVTFRNSHPGPHLIDVQQPDDVAPAIEQALTRPQSLMDDIRAYTLHHEAHREGHNGENVLKAVDDFVDNHYGRLPHKPLNLVRKIKLRKQMGYPVWKKLF